MKALLDFLPLVIFFAVYKMYGIMPATGALVVATLITTALIYLKERKIAAMPLISAGLVAIFGVATLMADDPLFIKLKPTILYIIMGAILIIGALVFRKGLLEYVMGAAVSMPARAWRILSVRWGLFFLLMAAVNEVVWRNFSEDIWVNFKVFGFLPILLLFAVSQAPFMMQWQKDKKK